MTSNHVTASHAGHVIFPRVFPIEIFRGHVTLQLNARAIEAGVPVSQAMVLCVVFGCSKRSGRDKDVSFFGIPKVIYNKGDKIQQRFQGLD